MAGNIQMMAGDGQARGVGMATAAYPANFRPASAKALMNTRNGESRSSGSERRKRFRSGMSTGWHGGAEADLVAQLHPAGSAEKLDLLGEPAGFLL